MVMYKVIDGKQESNNKTPDDIPGACSRNKGNACEAQVTDDIPVAFDSSHCKLMNNTKCASYGGINTPEKGC